MDIEALRCGGPFARILNMVYVYSIIYYAMSPYSFFIIVHLSDNNFFLDDWVAEITKCNEGTNWRLKENNLRKVSFHCSIRGNRMDGFRYTRVLMNIFMNTCVIVISTLRNGISTWRRVVSLLFIISPLSLIRLS